MFNCVRDVLAIVEVTRPLLNIVDLANPAPVRPIRIQDILCDPQLLVGFAGSSYMVNLFWNLHDALGRPRYMNFLCGS